MPDNLKTDLPNDTSGLLGAALVALVWWFKSIFNKILAAALRKHGDSLEDKQSRFRRDVQRDMDELRRGFRRLEARLDKVEDHTPGLVRLTEDGRDD